MYFLRLVKKMRDSSVVVESIDNVSHVLAHINLCIPLAGEKLGSSVNEVSGEYAIDNTVAVCLVHIFKTVTEKTEGREYEDTLCTLFLKLIGNVNYGIR